MDIKSKKFSPLFAWLCFFIGSSVVIFLTFTAYSTINNGVFTLRDVRDIVNPDFKDTMLFKDTISLEFASLKQLIIELQDASDAGTGNNYVITQNFKQEEPNLLYYAEKTVNSKLLTQQNFNFTLSQGGHINLPEGYNYYLYFNGEKFYAMKDGIALDVYDKSTGYRNTVLAAFLDQDYSAENKNLLSNCRLLLVVKKDIVENSFGYSSLYDNYKNSKFFGLVGIVLLIVYLLSIAAILLSIIQRLKRKEFVLKVGKFTGRILLEIKLLLLILIFGTLTALISTSYYSLMSSILEQAILLLIVWWTIYFAFTDLKINKGSVFSNNIIQALIMKYRSFERKKPVQKAMLQRAYGTLAILILLIPVAVLLAALLTHGNGTYLSIPVILVVGLYLLYRYFRRFGHTVRDLGSLIDQIDGIQRGDLSENHSIRLDADLFPAQENLNRIQEGFSRSMEERIRSERMKVELITNVSHDLKTPLTSIVSYVDLLAREEGLPEHVTEYVSILSQKSERLKTLIQDLFDLSKAASGEMKIEKERLDIVKLLQQTMADMNEDILKSGLAFRERYPEEPLYIESDGSKLYRVFQNLLGNALKYSLAGSRVYVDVEKRDGRAWITLRNTANYEMNFKEEEIVERFVRGDEARSTEGSGLGLSIARSFTQACGGALQVKIDGDLFKVILQFALC